MNISMIFSSCDTCDDAWVPFFTQLKKNWPEFDMPVYVSSQSKTFKFDGFDIRCPLAGGPVYNKWSERLLQLLKCIDSEYILFTLEDYWLTAPVDNAKFERICSYMENNKRMGFVCLKKENMKPEYNLETEYPELVRCTKDKRFRITAQIGIWKKSYLCKILRSHESAWYFETRATWRSKFYWERVYDVKESVFVYPVSGFFVGGKCCEDYKGLFDDELIRPCVEKRGFIKFGDREHRDYPPTPQGLSYYWSVFRSALPKL
jgi:hypothetical protein